MQINKYQKPDVMFLRPTPEQEQRNRERQAANEAVDRFDKEYGSQPHWKGNK